MNIAAFRSWLRRHGYSLLSSIGQLVREPLATSMTVAVLAVALALPLGLHTLLLNIDRVHSALDRLDSISVFLAADADAESARRLASSLSSRDDVLAVDPVPPEQGLAELAGSLGIDRTALDQVPLPWVLQVVPAAGADPAGLARALDGLPEVEMVIVDLEWVHRFEAIIGVIRALVRVLAVVFGLSLIFVIANTIRTEVQRRREEIEVLSLVGATVAYIRRPFLYTGLWLALGGAALAWLLVRVCVWALEAPVTRLARSYGSDLALTGPSLELLVPLMAASALLGIAGAWLAVSRELQKLGP
ncbi:MAG: permease-like cell division protein FtsX [Wenzhouxiangellaceae bacterium]